MPTNACDGRWKTKETASPIPADAMQWIEPKPQNACDRQSREGCSTSATNSEFRLTIAKSLTEGKVLNITACRMPRLGCGNAIRLGGCSRSKLVCRGQLPPRFLTMLNRCAQYLELLCSQHGLLTIRFNSSEFSCELSNDIQICIAVHRVSGQSAVAI